MNAISKFWDVIKAHPKKSVGAVAVVASYALGVPAEPIINGIMMILSAFSVGN